MDRTIFLAFLALLVVVQVKSYTLQDVLRNRLRQRELSRLREYDMYDANPVYDEREQALSWLRQFHFKRMFDDGNGKPDCVDNRNDCHGAKLNGLCDELKYPPEHQDKHTVDFITRWCRKTCDVDNCNGGVGEIKPTKPPAPGIPGPCKDDAGELCKGWGLKGYCKEDEYGHTDLQRYMFMYCSLTCSRILGIAIGSC